MITSLRSRPVPVLDTRTEHWDTKAACRHEPDVWFDHPGLARHICHAHCPVFEQCRRDVPLVRPQASVMAGVMYMVEKSLPVTHQPIGTSAGCPWCEVAT